MPATEPAGLELRRGIDLTPNGVIRPGTPQDYRRLRAEPWAAPLRLIALTGMGRAYDIELTRAAGFEAHLTKPVELDALIGLLNEARTRLGKAAEA
jgi:hypothetical protein